MMTDFMEIVEIERYITDRILKQYDLLKQGHITTNEYMERYSKEIEMLKKVKALNRKIFDVIR